MKLITCKRKSINLEKNSKNIIPMEDATSIEKTRKSTNKLLWRGR